MASIRQGKCNNFGNCTKADRGEIIDIVNNSVQPPLCPECGLPLMVLSSDNPMKKWLMPGIGAIVLSIIGLVIGGGTSTEQSTKNDAQQIIENKQSMPVPASELPQPKPESHSSDETPIQNPQKSEIQAEQDIAHSKLTDIELKAGLDRAFFAASAARTLKKGTAPWEEKTTNAIREYKDIINKNGEPVCKDLEHDSDDKITQATAKDRLILLAKSYAGLAAVMDESGRSDFHNIQEILLKGQDCLEPNVSDVNARRAIYQNLFELRLKYKNQVNDDDILDALNYLAKDSAVINDFGDRRGSFCSYLKNKLSESHIPKNSNLYRDIKVRIKEQHRIPCDNL